MLTKYFDTKQSITTDALKWISFNIAGVIIIATAVAYWYAYNSFRNSVIKNISSYVELRSKADSEHFLLAEKQSRMLRDEFLRRLHAMGDYDPKSEFDK